MGELAGRMLKDWVGGKAVPSGVIFLVPNSLTSVVFFGCSISTVLRFACDLSGELVDVYVLSLLRRTEMLSSVC